jgi:hypothetical protein
MGFAAGPFDPKDRPANAKVSGLMCRLKPNGAARVILNFSSPEGSCVNDGINNDDFPTTMSSTGEWLKVLSRCGKGALMLKIDWAAAYKHIHVRSEDIVLQYINWLGKDFVELMLVFGAKSSAGIYDRLAKFVLLLVLAYSRFPRKQVCQYLDDVCAAAAAGSNTLHKFQQAYKAVASEIGVQLASTDDPDKAFAPRTNGVILGIHYDTVQWTWCIPQEKLARVLLQIKAAITADTLPQHEIWSLVGRLLNYSPLIPAARFNINHLIKANNTSKLRRFPAIGRVAAALGCTVHIEKITRRSDTGAMLSDDLSKGRFDRFTAQLPADHNLKPAWIPPAILAWISNPVCSHELGEKILDDIRKRTYLL